MRRSPYEWDTPTSTTSAAPPLKEEEDDDEVTYPSRLSRGDRRRSSNLSGSTGVSPYIHAGAREPRSSSMVSVEYEEDYGLDYGKGGGIGGGERGGVAGVAGEVLEEVEEETQSSGGLFSSLGKLFGGGGGTRKEMEYESNTEKGAGTSSSSPSLSRRIFLALFAMAASAVLVAFVMDSSRFSTSSSSSEEEDRPDFVYEHPYVSSSYYTSTKSMKTLKDLDVQQVQPKKVPWNGEGKDPNRQVKTRLAIVRPFCEFDAEALPTTFTCWNSLAPCKTAAADLGQLDEDFDDEDAKEEEMPFNPDEVGEEKWFDDVGSDLFRDAGADLFLFYSQTFSENEVAIKAVDEIINSYNEPGGWSQCFENIYAIEANIPQELDLYIPSAQEELYNWVNGPNRQFEAAFRIIQSGEWGHFDGFYLMEGDSVPIKSHWLDVVLSEIEGYRPFAILGAQYDGDKWDNFYEQIPLSLLHHTNGNAIYNTSHPLMERLVGQLEVEAPCPYNSIPYDYRMSQMWVEGTLQIVPKLAPKIMLNEEGENITLSNNTAMFSKWADMFAHEDPFRYTKVIHNYAATNLIPRHLGPEYIIHGAKLYSPWDPTRINVTLVVSEWFSDRSAHLLSTLDQKDHPFSEVVIMLPPTIAERDDYEEMTVVPVRSQHRQGPDHMDLCDADVHSEWFMITNSYHHVATHVDLMFTPGTFKPVVPFTPATYPFCFKYAYCKETVALAQRFKSGFDKVVQDFDMLYHTEDRNKFCDEWRNRFGAQGEDLYKHQKQRLLLRKKIVGPSGPSGTSYTSYLAREGKDGMYKMTDRSLYGARDAFIKIFAKEEKMDSLTPEELALRTGLNQDNQTDCNCKALESKEACEGSGIGCLWRPLFESCHPPEMMDDGAPICPQTDAPTMAPTVYLEARIDETDAPTISPTKAPVQPDPWYANLFKTREHERLKLGGDTETYEETAGRDGEVQEDDDFVVAEIIDDISARRTEDADEEGGDEGEETSSEKGETDAVEDETPKEDGSAEN